MTTLRLRANEVEWREVDDEIVILDLQSGQYLTINSSGSGLFRRIVEGATVDDLVQSLLDTYEISETEAAADVEEFLNTLRGHGLTIDGDG